jgi:hypothetical protein
MAVWAAVLDGVNDRATFASVTTSNNIDVEVVMTFNSLNGGAILSDGGVANFFRYNAGTLRFRCLGFLGNSMSFTPVIGQKYTLGAALRSTGVELFVDGASIGTSNGSPTGMLINTIGFFNSTFYLGCTIERLTVTDNTTPANSFDLYNDVVAGSSVNWPDQTANARNGTLVNTPTDGSQWLEVGGSGISITAESGTYLYSGTDAQLLTARILKADSGAYSYTGSTVNLLKGFVLTANSGSYSYLGQDATLTYTPAGAFILTADSGNYTYTGANINFNRDRVIIAVSGTYNYNGTDIQIILPGQIWTDKPSVSTNWDNQAATTTIWTDK